MIDLPFGYLDFFFPSSSVFVSSLSISLYLSLFLSLLGIKLIYGMMTLHSYNVHAAGDEQL